MDTRVSAVIHLPSCTGCAACELACSFQRTGAFAPHVSSVTVDANRTGPFGILTFSDSCDLCRDLEMPECVRRCPPQALTRRELESALNTAREGRP